MTDHANQPQSPPSDAKNNEASSSTQQAAATVPPAAGSPPSQQSKDAQAAKKEASKGTVLVLEDSDPSRNVIKFFLEKNKYTVVGFRNGREALDYINKNQIQDLRLIFSDIMMPEIDGLEFLRKLKDTNKFPDVPILMTTAMTDKDSILEARKLGVAGYLLKPISIKKLTDVLRKMFPQETFIDVSVKF